MDAPKGIAEVARQEAEELADVLGKKIGEAGAALAGPREAHMEELLPQTDLPEVPATDALVRLSTRLDREADFFRSLAVRELAAAAWIERLAFVGGIVLSLCAIAVSVSLVFTLVIGGENAAGRALLAVVALAALGTATAMLVATGRGPRLSRLAAAKDALDRAHAVEKKIEDVSLLFEWRAQGNALYQEALARTERLERSR